MVFRGELIFLGLGLYSGHLTLEAVNELKRADIVYLELYTGIYEDADYLEKLVGTEKIVRLSRKELEEENGDIIMESLKNGLRVVLASPGDPFIATSHQALKIRAMREGFKVRVIHGLSILSVAVSESGLFSYKFGKSATIVYPKDGIVYEYPYLVLEENISRGLHTLFLLEIDVDQNMLMTANEAMEIMLELERARGKKIFTENTMLVVLARAGTPNKLVRAGRVGELLKTDFGHPPHTIIVPGKLHFIEEEALRTIGDGV